MLEISQNQSRSFQLRFQLCWEINLLRIQFYWELNFAEIAIYLRFSYAENSVLLRIQFYKEFCFTKHSVLLRSQFLENSVFAENSVLLRIKLLRHFWWVFKHCVLVEDRGGWFPWLFPFTLDLLAHESRSSFLESWEMTWNILIINIYSQHTDFPTPM